MWEILQQWQHALGAGVGFLALAAAALFNAHLSRKRDDRLQGLDRWLLAQSLLAEVRTIVAQLQALKAYGERTKVANPFESARKLQMMVIPLEAVYPRVLAKIGLLNADVAQSVTHFYGLLSVLRKRADVSMPELEPASDVIGMFGIAGGERVESALYAVEQMLPVVVQTGLQTAQALMVSRGNAPGLLKKMIRSGVVQSAVG
jgi:hypothetical protein